MLLVLSSSEVRTNNNIPGQNLNHTIERLKNTIQTVYILRPLVTENVMPTWQCHEPLGTHDICRSLIFITNCIKGSVNSLRFI